MTLTEKLLVDRVDALESRVDKMNQGVGDANVSGKSALANTSTQDRHLSNF